MGSRVLPRNIYMACNETPTTEGTIMFTILAQAALVAMLIIAVGFVFNVVAEKVTK